MIPPVSPSPSAETTPCRISTLSNPFHSLVVVCIGSRMAPHGTTMSTVGVNRYDIGTTICSHKVWSVPQVRSNQLTVWQDLADHSNLGTLFSTTWLAVVRRTRLISMVSWKRVLLLSLCPCSHSPPISFPDSSMWTRHMGWLRRIMLMRCSMNCGWSTTRYYTVFVD